MLIFDEADSLFSNRSKINGGRGRYANTESRFLLQRVERHMSLAIIATNLEGRIDQALPQEISTLKHWSGFRQPEVTPP